MTDLGALLLVLLTAIYWLKKNKDLIIWQKKLEVYQNIADAFYTIMEGNLIKKLIKTGVLSPNKKKDQLEQEKVAMAYDILSRVIETNGFIISDQIINIIDKWRDELEDLLGDNKKGYEKILFDSLPEFIEEARIDLQTIQPSFSRSIRNIWRDIKLFCR